MVVMLVLQVQTDYNSLFLLQYEFGVTSVAYRITILLAFYDFLTGTSLQSSGGVQTASHQGRTQRHDIITVNLDCDGDVIIFNIH